MSALVLIGGVTLGFLSALIFLLILSIFCETKRPKNHFANIALQSPPLEKKRETASWLNIIFARINSSTIDAAVLENVCKILTKEILSDPNRPPMLTEVKISPFKMPKKSPLFTDFVITPNEGYSTLSFCIQYQGQPSLSLFCSSSGGPSDLPILFTINIHLEFLLRLLVAKLSISFDSNNEYALLNIGNDLIVELNFKPIFDGPQNNQQRYIESISSWMSNFILKKLRGKTFPIFNNSINSSDDLSWSDDNVNDFNSDNDNTNNDNSNNNYTRRSKRNDINDEN